jgi:hypothetical protein
MQTIAQRLAVAASEGEVVGLARAYLDGLLPSDLNCLPGGHAPVIRNAADLADLALAVTQLRFRAAIPAACLESLGAIDAVLGNACVRLAWLNAYRHQFGAAGNRAGAASDGVATAR